MLRTVIWAVKDGLVCMVHTLRRHKWVKSSLEPPSGCCNPAGWLLWLVVKVMCPKYIL